MPVATHPSSRLRPKSKLGRPATLPNPATLSNPGKANGKPTPAREGVEGGDSCKRPSAYPTGTPSVDILYELSTNREEWMLSGLEPADIKSIELTAFPRHLYSSAMRINMQLGEQARGGPPGVGRVLDCALSNGLTLLREHEPISRFISIRQQQYLKTVSGMLSAITEDLVSSWTVSIPAPFGIKRQQIKTASSRFYAHHKFAEDLGIPINVCGALCVCYGLYYQEGLIPDYSSLIRDAVRSFDVYVGIKVSMSNLIVEYVEELRR